MSSPDTSHPRPGSVRRSSFALQQDDSFPISAKGHGALATLIRNRSHASLHRGALSHWSLGADDEEAGVPDWPALRVRDDDDDDVRRSEERRMSAILNGPQMRSMRLIGQSNPRYKWERYWKTAEDLNQMQKKM